MSNEVPDGWRAMAFSEAVIVNPKRSLPKSGTVPFLDMASLPLHGAPVQVIDARPLASGGSKFQKGDTLFARITPCAENGKLGFVSDVDGGPVAQGSTEFIVMGPRDGLTLPEYVRWLSGWDYVRNHAIGLMEGTSGRQRIPAWAFDEIEIGVPPLGEQQRIAEVLRSVEEAIAANETVAVQARATYQAALTELVGKGGDHWETAHLGELATFVNGRGFKPHEWNDEGLPIIRIQNLNGGTDFNYYKGDFNPKILVQPGDLLFAWSGSRGTSFGPHIWRGPQGVLNYHTWKVVPKVPEDRDYLYFALRHLTKKIEDEAHGASALVHMQKAYVVDYEIELPSLDERRAIATTLIDLLEAAYHANRLYSEAMAMRNHLLHDLLSGHVRVPAVTNSSTRSVPPAFKRAVFAAEIVHQLHNDNRFGSVKHEKIVHLCELHLGLQDDLDRHAYKEAAGPYDPKARRSVESIFRQQKWFDTTKPDGNRVVYVPLEKAGGHNEYFDRYFGDQKPEVQSIIDILRPLNTERCEIVATLYAVWNDFLIDGKQPTEEEIVASVLQWHPKKQQIAKDRWLAALPWMRQKGLIPKGIGEKTRVAQA
nr:restriction endonuclease subunit S [uncultured Agrobacterium sp.]